MADKRKKRHMMAATASHHDSASKDFHVVNIGEPGAQAPRRRSASAGRSDSWMTKVTSAMSHRIFSGRRMSGSRSTQVMPMLKGNDTVAQPDSKNSDRIEATPFTRTGMQTMRLVSSEATLSRTAPSLARDSVKRVDTECPTVVCDIVPDEFSDADQSNGLAHARAKCSVSKIHVRTPQKAATLSRATTEKIYPRACQCDDEGDALVQLTYLGRHAGMHDDPTDEEAPVQAAAPILKDFFSRNATNTQHERAKQRESRRDNHYQRMRQRHERLRERCEEEAQHQAEESQRNKVERLRKLNQQRRLKARQEASRLKKYATATGESAQNRFLSARERWEHEFEDEIEALGSAFRKVYTKEGVSERPMTVAGLAVPEAMMQIQRETSHHARRLHTAAPAGWSSEFRDLKRIDTSEFDFFRADTACAGLEEDGEAAASTLSTEGWTIPVLLAERADMMRRIDELEKHIDLKQSVTVEGGAEGASGSKDEGFFI